MNTRDALRRLEELGATVTRVAKDGDYRVSHPAFPKALHVNHPTRDKDAAHTLVRMVRRVEGSRK